MTSVVHIVAPAPYGGLESVVTTLASGQAKAGDNVEVVLVMNPGADDHPMLVDPRLAGVRVTQLHVAPRSYLEERRRLRSLLAERPCEVLHSHGYRPDLVDAPVARKSGIPTVTTVHGFTHGSLRGRVNEWLQVRAFRRFEAVVAVSAPLAEQLVRRGVPEHRVHTEPNAWEAGADTLDRVSARLALGLPVEAPIIGWVGRMSAEKAPDLALTAHARVADPRVHLALIGAGPMTDALQLKSVSEGAGPIHWLGVVPDAGRYMTAFDALLLTSWTEGTPMVLLEAMAAGVPIVTTAVGGIPELLGPEHAVLVGAGDGDGLSAGLRSVLTGDPAAAGFRAIAAKERLERHFAVGPWVQRYDRIYEAAQGITLAPL